MCNMGASTRTVIGVGVYDAHVSMSTDHKAIFELARKDAPKCMVRLRCLEGGRGRDLRMYASAEADMR